MIKYFGINALKEIFKNKKFFDNIVLLINETAAVSNLKDIKIQALYTSVENSNNKKEIKLTDGVGTGDIMIDCGEAADDDSTLPGNVG